MEKLEPCALQAGMSDGAAAVQQVKLRWIHRMAQQLHFWVCTHTTEDRDFNRHVYPCSQHHSDLKVRH